VLSEVVAVVPFLGNGDSDRTATTPHYNTLQSYTNISNTAVGNKFIIKMFHRGFMQVPILQSLKSQCYKIIKTLKYRPIYKKMG